MNHDEQISLLLESIAVDRQLLAWVIRQLILIGTTPEYRLSEAEVEQFKAIEKALQWKKDDDAQTKEAFQRMGVGCHGCGCTKGQFNWVHKQCHGEFKKVLLCDSCKKKHEEDLERTRQNFYTQFGEN